MVGGSGVVPDIKETSDLHASVVAAREEVALRVDVQLRCKRLHVSGVCLGASQN